ncbi:DgyrCDS11260 [Dimorphilus gyrociliatus]|uniref:DgyrCDS11260 n=1 Tax=Dimorphilus gyrociliatus TaxID=2664684 RepID=A0A7I8W3S9_9ANNE|nr:DgyrCDS11260 [Dimorphilus gyrociliatus]
MNYLLLFTLAIYILKYSNANFVCPIDSEQKPINGAYRDPNLCGIYYHCVDGFAYPQQCPPGLHFQLSATTCHFFACVQSSQSDCLKVKNSNGKKDSIIHEKIPQIKANECLPNLNSTVASSTNPSLYFNCVNGLAWPQQCPPQTKFNPNFNFDKCSGEICRKSSGGSQPIHGGNNCQGQSSESEQCTNGPCSQNGPAFMVSLTETTNENAGIMNWKSVNLNSGGMFNAENNEVAIRTSGLYFFSMVSTTTNGNLINMAIEKTGINLGITKAAYEGAEGPETMSRSGLAILTPIFKPQMRLISPTSLYSTAEGRETSWLGFHYKSDSYLFCGSDRRLPGGYVKWPKVTAMKGFRENSILSQFRVESSGLYFLNAGMLSDLSHREEHRIRRLNIQIFRNNALFATVLQFSASIQTNLATEQFSGSNLVHLVEGDVLTAHIILPISSSIGPLAGNNTETYMSAFKMNESLAYFQAENTDSTCNEFRRVNLKTINMDSTSSWNATRNEYIVQTAGIYFLEFTFQKYYNSKLELRMFLNGERVALSMKMSSLDKDFLFTRTLLLDLKKNDKFHWENYVCFTETLEGKVIHSNDLTFQEGETLEKCKLLCINNVLCKSIDLETVGLKRCFLNSVTPAEVGVSLVDNVDFIYSGPKDGICDTVEVNARCSRISNTICGSTTTTQSQCNLNGCCFSNNVCYYDDTSVPGFVQTRREGQFTTYLEVDISISLEECNRRCLSKSLCRCFTYNSETTVCILTTENCKVSGSTVHDKISSYQRTAYKKVTCYSANCNFEPEFDTEDFTICRDNCISESTCEYFVYTFDNQQNKCSTQETTICDTFSPTFRELNYINTCVNGPVFKDTIRQKDTKLIHITDSDNPETCVDVSLAMQFSLRVPWPSVDHANQNFYIEITGHNFNKCIDKMDQLSPTGLLVYVPIAMQVDPLFEESFLGCSLISGDDMSNCKYLCSCGLQYCQAVYIKAFGDTNENMKVCHYNIINL